MSKERRKSDSARRDANRGLVEALITWAHTRPDGWWSWPLRLVLLFAFARFLVTLSGAALLLPPSLYAAALAIGMAAGFAALRLGQTLTARTSEESARRREARRNDPGKERRKRPSRRQRERARRSAVNRALWALQLVFAMALGFVTFMHLQARCVVQWDPPDSIVDDYGWRSDGTEGLSDHLHMRAVGDSMRGTVFVPLWYSHRTQLSIEARRDDGDPIQSLLDNNLAEFLGWLEGRDAPYVAWTITIFFALYLWILTTGSLAWSLSASAGEELAGEGASFGA